MNRISRHIASLSTLVAALVLFAYFFGGLPYHLFYREQTQLFMYTSYSLEAYFKYPGILACLAGDFLTQFFYYEGGGPVIVTLVLLVWGIVVYRLFFPYMGKWALLLAAVAVVWETARQSGVEYPLSATLALIGGGGCSLLIRRLMQRFGERTFVVKLLALVAVAGSYMLFGYGCFLTAVFLFNKRQLLLSCLLLFEAAIAPIYGHRSCLLTWKQAYTYPSTTWFNRPDFHLERMLAVDSEYYFGRINKVEGDLSVIKTKHLLPTYYYNLLNGHKGVLPLQLMNVWQPGSKGLFLPVIPTSDYMEIYAANEVWFELGDMTMAEHAALLGMIFSPRHAGARAIKRLAEINLVNGDDAAAMKYLRMLGKTLCYREWATKRLPGKQTERVRKWLEEKKRVLPRRDTLRRASDIRLSLRCLLSANRKNVMACDYLLCYDLLSKRIGDFFTDFREFYGERPLCRLYAEGLLIYLAGSGQSPESVRQWKIPLQVCAEFSDYSKVYERSRGDGTFLESKYGKTYWFYFHYARIRP